MEQNNIIKVTSSNFFVNRRDPRQVSYGFVSEAEWRPIMLSTYVNNPPEPTPGQIMYVLAHDPKRAAYSNL